MKSTNFIVMVSVFAVCACFSIMPGFAGAHCDTLAGPVVKEAEAALEKGDITPILKWAKKEHEGEIKEAFNKTLAVRKQGKEAQELADVYFFETLVRIHRAGEGAPYTGIKPGEAIEPITAESDEALKKGSADGLVKDMTNAVAKGILERFTHVKETKKHAGESVEAGREFVATYVEFTHYVERLHMDAVAKAGHHEGVERPETKEHYHH